MERQKEKTKANEEERIASGRLNVHDFTAWDCIKQKPYVPNSVYIESPNKYTQQHIKGRIPIGYIYSKTNFKILEAYKV